MHRHDMHVQAGWQHAGCGAAPSRAWLAIVRVHPCPFQRQKQRQRQRRRRQQRPTSVWHSITLSRPSRVAELVATHVTSVSERSTTCEGGAIQEGRELGDRFVWNTRASQWRAANGAAPASAWESLPCELHALHHAPRHDGYVQHPPPSGLHPRRERRPRSRWPGSGRSVRKGDSSGHMSLGARAVGLCECIR